MSETTPNSTRERRNETNQAAVAKNAYKRKDKHMEEKNNVVTRAPPTYNSSNARKVGL